MPKIKIKKLIPYFTAIILFLIISLAYFPDVMQGKKLNQHDKKVTAKMSLIEKIKQEAKHDLTKSTYYGEKKLNLFFIDLK